MDAVFALSLLLLRALPVSGGSECPTPDQVNARVRLLAAEADPGGVRASVEASDGIVRLELRDDAGALLASKAFDGTASCADLAEASAVFIATWLLQPRQAEVAAPQLPLIQLPLPRPPERSLFFGAGAAGGALLGAGAFRVELEGFAGAGAWLGALAISWTSWADTALGPGTIAWHRLAARGGPGRRWTLGPFALEARASFVAALLQVEGRGFDVDRRLGSFDPGFGLDLRLEDRFGRLSPWLGLSATGWLKSRNVVVEGVDSSVALPRVEVVLSMGIRWWSP